MIVERSIGGTSTTWPGRTGKARGHRLAKLPSMISASVPQTAIARTRAEDFVGAGLRPGNLADLERVPSG